MARHSRGVALVLVLWVLSLLMLMVGAFVYAASTETQLASTARGHAQARALADAGLQYAAWRLLRMRSQRDLQAAEIPIDGSPVTWRFGPGRVRLEIVSESGLVDLNAAEPELLERLFEWVGMGPEQAAEQVAILQDWRDGNHVRRNKGAEDSDYRAAGLRAGAKDARFDRVEELRQVMGITDRVYERLAPFLTVHSGNAKVNPRFAPAKLVAVLAEDAGRAESFVESRSGAAGSGSRRLGGRFFNDRIGRSFRITLQATLDQREARAYERVTIALEPRRQPPYRVLSRSEGDYPRSVPGSGGAQLGAR